MNALRRISTFEWPNEHETADVEFGRYLLELSSPREWPARQLDLTSEFFILFVVANFHEFSVGDWTVFVKKALDAGCAYVCTWGEGCKELHDLFDSVLVEADPRGVSDRFVVTTWHDDESMELAIWFATFVARPDEATRYVGRTRAIISCSVGNKQYAEGLESILLQPRVFADEVVGETGE